MRAGKREEVCEYWWDTGATRHESPLRLSGAGTKRWAPKSLYVALSTRTQTAETKTSELESQ